MKYKYSQKLSAIRNRIKNLPQIFERSKRAVLKRDADGLAKEFEEGIKNNQLGLEPLKQKTIESKKRNGYAKPGAPLFARGKFAEMMTVKQKGKKWVVAPANKQFTSKLKLIDILEIHANGALIKRGETIIRLPARPARARAFSLYLRKRKKVDTNKQVWDAINGLIRENKIKNEPTDK